MTSSDNQNIIPQDVIIQDTLILALSAEIADLWHGQRDWLMIAHAAAAARPPLPPPAFTLAAPGTTRTVTRIIFPCYTPGAAVSLTAISATETFQRLIEAECMLGDPVEPARIAELVQWVQGRPADILCYDRLDEAVKVMHQIATP